MRPIYRFLPDSISRFLRDQNGAVTVDFVVLTAAVVGLSIAIYTLVGNATDDHADRIGTKIQEVGIQAY